MNPIKSLLATVTASVLLTQQQFAAEGPGSKPHEIEGPAKTTLGAHAEFTIPQGYSFLDGKTVKAWLEAAGQPVSEDIVGSVGPTNAEWSVIFYFDDCGYVKDDDKDKLDADKLLKQFQKATEEANEYRAKSGNPPIHVTGWEVPPRYNPETHNLEWAIRGTCENENILNYDTRLLGRKGIMKVKLIVDPKEFAATLPVFTNMMSGFKFVTGETYAEYKPGDKIAKYGLGALVLGGAAVGAAKLGLLGPVILFFKKGWKLLIVAVVAVASFFKKIFNKITGRGGE